MSYDDSTRQGAAPHRPLWPGIVTAIVLAALVGLGTWLVTSLVRSGDSVTGESSELTAAQHIEHLVRVLRISATSDTTPSQLQTIPEAAVNSEPVTCDSRYAQALEQATIQLHGIEYFSTVAGARAVDTELWSAQQSEAHDGALALTWLFPPECEPVVPVTFVLSDTLRSADGISIGQMVQVSDEVMDAWSQLYLLAETAPERELALAGLWQVISWETTWQPGNSPFTFTS